MSNESAIGNRAAAKVTASAHNAASVGELQNEKALALRAISDRFAVGDTVRALQGMMTEVTKKEITPDTVNAACNCVQNLNLTIRTAIMAAKYLSEK